jgi:Flp pilus assembly protein TadG
MRRLRDRSGVAAVETALVAPIFVALMIGTLDMCAALLSKAQIAQALATAGQYATLAGQNKNTVATATIIANAKAYAGAVSNSFLGTPTTKTAVINNNAAAGSKCCLPSSTGGAWTCSTSTTSCADGSTPASYITITVTYPFKPLFPADSLVLGKSLSGSIVAPLQ